MKRYRGRLVLLGFVLLVGAFVAFVYWPALWPVSPKALHYSLARATGSASVLDDEGCDPHGRAWSCVIYDSEGSGTAPYVLEMRGRRCWSATKVGRAEEGDLPQRVSGCVGLRDRVRLWATAT